MKSKTSVTVNTVGNDAVAGAATETLVPGRRRVLEILGTGALALPILGLSACGGDKSATSAPASAVKSTMAPATDAMKNTAAAAMEKAEAVSEEVEMAVDDAADSMQDMAEDMGEDMGEAASDAAQTIASDALPKVDENGPQAMGLGYKHEASTVDTATHSRYAAGQQCSNCALYQGGDSAWGGCPLFTGQQVKATGWCSAYAAAS